jgi:hypothetical protein
LRLRLIVYGLVAVCAALLLISRGGGSDDESATLRGSTTRGEPVSLKVVDGRVESFTAKIGVRCAFQRVWHGWVWSARGTFGGEGKSFGYSDGDRFPDGGRFTSVLRGRLIGDGESARGTIETRGTWPGTGGGRTPCQSSLAFEVSKPDQG